MAKCATCGTMNEDAAAFCDQCGAALSAAAPAFPQPPVQQAYPPAPTPVPGPASMGGGMNCPQCGTPNMAGTLFCDQCGASLSGVAPAAPVYPPPQPPYVPPQAPVYQPPVAPPAPGFPPVQQVPMPPPVSAAPPVPCRLVVAGQQITVPPKAEAIVGRSDLASGWNPDVDLTGCGGTPEAGVSRKHLKIVWQGMWMVEDMNSVNGTYLRGQRMAPGQRVPINTGEVLQLGKLQITFMA